MRTALRAGTEIQSLGFHQKASRDYLISLTQGVTQALDERDSSFGDYRTHEKGKRGS